MALFTIESLRSEFQSSLYQKSKRIYENLDETAAKELNERTQNFSRLKNYDIFLSHSIKDATAILMLVDILERYGLTVYVDWIADPQLDRSRVTTATAKTIQERLSACKSLLLALSHNSTRSSWVQWELGLGDGKKDGRVAIVPIIESNDVNRDFYKQEYLGLYPYIDYYGTSLFVNGVTKHLSLKDWMNLTIL